MTIDDLTDIDPDMYFLKILILYIKTKKKFQN